MCIGEIDRLIVVEWLLHEMLTSNLSAAKQLLASCLVLNSPVNFGSVRDFATKSIYRLP